jgi:hypothetical protein
VIPLVQRIVADRVALAVAGSGAVARVGRGRHVHTVDECRRQADTHTLRRARRLIGTQALARVPTKLFEFALVTTTATRRYTTRRQQFGRLNDQILAPQIRVVNSHRKEIKCNAERIERRLKNRGVCRRIFVGSVRHRAVRLCKSDHGDVDGVIFEQTHRYGAPIASADLWKVAHCVRAYLSVATDELALPSIGVTAVQVRKCICGRTFVFQRIMLDAASTVENASNAKQPLTLHLQRFR